MKKLFILSVILILVVPLSANTIIVDQNGGGQFTTIQAAIQAASSGDTVKVWPGTYNTEQVNLNKTIVLMGSGYENTSIVSNFNPAVRISAGILQWFMITSLNGDGMVLDGTQAVVRSCVIANCLGRGIVSNTGTNSIINCVLVNNSNSGVQADAGATINVTNCIARPNGGVGFDRPGYTGGVLNLSFSNGSNTYTTGNQGVININPAFVSAIDFHISQGSPCWDTGNTSLTDPDGSRSDMGYFGGPDCPIYPTVFEILIEPNGNNINLKAKARANY